MARPAVVYRVIGQVIEAKLTHVWGAVGFGNVRVLKVAEDHVAAIDLRQGCLPLGIECLLGKGGIEIDLGRGQYASAFFYRDFVPANLSYGVLPNRQMFINSEIDSRRQPVILKMKSPIRFLHVLIDIKTVVSLPFLLDSGEPYKGRNCFLKLSWISLSDCCAASTD